MKKQIPINNLQAHKLFRQSTIKIGHLRCENKNGISTISAKVSGERIWFKTTDTELRPDASSFLAAYFPSAQKLRLRLSVKDPVSPILRENLPKIASIHNEWWQTGPCPEIVAQKKPEASLPEKRKTALFFSCGVDSFDTLLRHWDSIDTLILVRGFDVALEEVDRFAALHQQAQAVAQDLNKELVVVETNLREHRLFRKGIWEHNHMAAFAAVGHLLADSIERVYISASYPSEALEPWGSHPLFDHLWSSEKLKIEHMGDDLWRLEKIGQHGKHPLFRKYLSVCWNSPGLPLNCGRCEKCIRNQLCFLVHKLDSPACFPSVIHLEHALNAISSVNPKASVYNETLKSEHIAENIKQAVKRCLARSITIPAELSDDVSSPWNEKTHHLRISSQNKGKRHEGGSPNEEEIGAYHAFLPPKQSRVSGTAVVLGMTPELRILAANHFKQVIAVDSGMAAIKQYKNWLPNNLRPKEKIYSIPWKHLPYIDWSAFPPVVSVLGDGVFGNFPNRKTQISFLEMLTTQFPKANLIFRKALAQNVGRSDEAILHQLREDFRAQKLTPDEFGFTVRLQGFLNTHYDAATAILDNAALFRDCENLYSEGFFNDTEIEFIRRFKFDGPNCLLTKEEWESMLNQSKLKFERTRLTGRRWYDFYPIYEVRPPELT